MFVFHQYYFCMRPKVPVRGRTSGAEDRHSEFWQNYFCIRPIYTFVFDQKFGSGAEHPEQRIAILSPSNTTFVFDEYMDKEGFGSGAEHPAPRITIILSPSNTIFVFDQKFGSGAEHPAPRIILSSGIILLVFHQYYFCIRPKVRVRGRTSGALSPSNTTFVFDQYYSQL